MNEDEQILEAELERLTLRAPSPALEARIAAELAGPVATPRQTAGQVRYWKPTLIFAPLVTAAAFALVVFRLTPDELRPVSIANVLYDTEDEGVVTLDNGQPAQRFRLHYIDTITWASARGGASLQWSQPREEIQLLPLTYN